jgi:hypothetical protein
MAGEGGGGSTVRPPFGGRQGFDRALRVINRSVSLPVAGYHYNSDWTSSVGGTLTR